MASDQPGSSSLRWFTTTKDSKPPHAFGALVSSLEVPQSMEVPLCGTPFRFCYFTDFNAPFLLSARADFRSLPFDVLPPRRASNGHRGLREETPVNGPAVCNVDVGFTPSALSSSFTYPSPNGNRNETATALQRSRLHRPFGATRLLLKRLSQSSAFPSPRYQ
jgi:hypothetical protein